MVESCSDLVLNMAMWCCCSPTMQPRAAIACTSWTFQLPQLFRRIILYGGSDGDKKCFYFKKGQKNPNLFFHFWKETKIVPHKLLKWIHFIGFFISLVSVKNLTYNVFYSGMLWLVRNRLSTMNLPGKSDSFTCNFIPAGLPEITMWVLLDTHRYTQTDIGTHSQIDKQKERQTLARISTKTVVQSFQSCMQHQNAIFHILMMLSMLSLRICSILTTYKIWVVIQMN